MEEAVVTASSNVYKYKYYGGIDMSKKTCAYCKARRDQTEMGYVKKSGKHRTYYCNIDCYNKAVERKQKREANQKAKVNSNEAS